MQKRRLLKTFKWYSSNTFDWSCRCNFGLRTYSFDPICLISPPGPAVLLLPTWGQSPLCEQPRGEIPHQTAPVPAPSSWQWGEFIETKTSRSFISSHESPYCFPSIAAAQNAHASHFKTPSNSCSVVFGASPHPLPAQKEALSLHISVGACTMRLLSRRLYDAARGDSIWHVASTLLWVT